jgi:hypothetical protein
MNKNLFFIALLTFLIYSCGGASTPAVYEDQYESTSDEVSGLTTSLFAEDREAIDDETVQKLLSSTIVLPKSNRVVLFELRSSNNISKYFGYSYWRNEEYYEIQNKYIETIKKDIKNNPRVSEVILLPSFIRPEKITLSNIRLASLRTQGNLILIFKIHSDIYERFRFFKENELKAFSTVEAFLLDARTGLIPFSTIITKKHLTTYKKTDHLPTVGLDAEAKSTVLALEQLSNEVSDFFTDKEKN